MLDPAGWGTSDSWTKPDPGATKHIVEHTALYLEVSKLIMALKRAFEAAYAKIESQAKSFHKRVPLPTAKALEINGEPAIRTLSSES